MTRMELSTLAQYSQLRRVPTQFLDTDAALRSDYCRTLLISACRPRHGTLLTLTNARCMRLNPTPAGNACKRNEIRRRLPQQENNYNIAKNKKKKRIQLAPYLLVLVEVMVRWQENGDQPLCTCQTQSPHRLAKHSGTVKQLVFGCWVFGKKLITS